MPQVKLSPAQQKSLNAAIDLYVIKNTRLHGGYKNKPVILVPAFELDTDGETWVPVQNNGVRATKKEHLSFMRLGMVTLSVATNGSDELKVLKTNMFNDDAKLQGIVELLDLKIGDQYPDRVLVVEESLTPFSQANPNRDIKVAGSTGVPCLLDDQPIYRRVKLAPVGTNSVFIAHNNIDAIRKAMTASRITVSNVPSPQQLAQELKTIKAIPKAQRTPEQNARLLELQD